MCGEKHQRVITKMSTKGGKRMNIDGILWMILPPLLIVLVLVLRLTVLKGELQSRKSLVVGIIVTAIIICFWIVLRLTHGGF